MRFVWLVWGVGIWAFIAGGVVPPSVTCPTSLAAEEDPHDAITIAELLEKDGVGFYLRLRERAYLAKSRGEDSFSFPEALPELRQMLADLDRRISGPGTEFAELRSAALELVARDIPYHAYLRFYFRYIKAVDRWMRAEDPSLQKTGNYHEDNAGEDVEPLIAQAPDVFLFPSFRVKPPAYFNKTRGVPVYIVDYSLTPLVHIDGFPLTPKERAYHDIGHAAFMARHDVWLFQQAGKSPEEVVREWSEVGKELGRRIRSHAGSRDKVRVADILLFEVLHERGYQYYPPFLMQQFDTTKWVDVIKMKVEKRYFEKPMLNAKQVALLPEVRLWLLAQIREISTADFLRRTQELKAREDPTRFKIWRPIETFHGVPFAIEAPAPDAVRVFMRTDKGELDTSIYEIALAQITVPEQRVFTAEKREALERLLHAQKTRAKVRLLREAEEPREYAIAKIYLNPEGVPLVDLHPDPDRNRIGVDISGLRLEGSERAEISSFQAFKIEQVLSLWHLGKGTGFTKTPPSEEVTGTLVDVSGGVATLRIGERDQTYPIATLSVP